MPTATPDDTPTAMYFEDFHVGQVFVSGAHQVNEDDLLDFARVSGDRSALHVDEEFAASTRFGRRILHGPYGLARYFGTLFESGTVETTAVALLDTNWTYHAPVFVGDELSYTCTITRCRRSRKDSTGVVNRHVTVARCDGVVAQSGSTAFLVKARGPRPPDGDPSGRDFCAPSWSGELAERLGVDEEFTGSTASFDGTIGLSCGTTETQLRIYRGRILEAARRTPLGATFTVQGSEIAWLRHLTADRNAFMQRALADEFSVSGNHYEYLRLTKPLMRLWDVARTMAADGVLS